MAKNRIVRQVPTKEQVKAAGYSDEAAENIIAEETKLRAAEDADPALADAYTKYAEEARLKEEADAKSAADAEEAAKAAAEGEGMAKKPLVEDGVNPNAPEVPLSAHQQLALKQGELNTHRAKMAEAKKNHEANLENVGRLRKLLSQGEAQLIDNDFEKLVQQEHVIMGQLNALQNSINSKQVGGVS